MAPVRRLAGVSIFLAVLALPSSAAAVAEDQPVGPAGSDGPSTTLSAHDVIVQWRPQADREERVSARESAAVSFRSDLGDRQFQLVRTEPGQSAGDAVRDLEADPAVAVAERDGYRRLDALPNDPLFGQLWGLRNTGAGINGFAGAVAGDDIDAAGAWLRTVGTPSTVVADIDSGYSFSDGDLGPVAWTNQEEASGEPGVDDDGNGFVDDVHGWDFVGASAEAPSEDNDPTDDNLVSGGHGLHTAGRSGPPATTASASPGWRRTCGSCRSASAPMPRRSTKHAARSARSSRRSTTPATTVPAPPTCRWAGTPSPRPK